MKIKKAPEAPPAKKAGTMSGRNVPTPPQVPEQDVLGQQDDLVRDHHRTEAEVEQWLTKLEPYP